ncbi:MAG: hypothetical protein GX362_00775 [Methanosarcinaceae archaeon]|nr:hypothetical protein [Methanosarcinaceae archaeon]
MIWYIPKLPYMYPKPEHENFPFYFESITTPKIGLNLYPFPEISEDNGSAQYKRIVNNENDETANNETLEKNSFSSNILSFIRRILGMSDESDLTYSIGIWYFEDYDEFLKQELILCDFLKKNGNVKNMEIDVSSEINKFKYKHRLSFGGPEKFNVTLYESDKTTGFFVSLEKPLHEPKDDYVIAYYGIDKSSLNDSDINNIKALITNSFLTNTGQVRALNI